VPTIDDMTSDDKKLIIRYERLRRQLTKLIARIAQVDDELVEIELHLPDEYTYEGDTPVV
jgi:hypothetical protein